MTMLREHRRAVLGSDIGAVAVLVVLAALTWLPRLEGPLDMRWDGAVYYVLGTSLAQGKGYRLLNEPGEIEAIQYPPLFPALIAVHQWIAGTSDPAVVGQLLRGSFLAISLIYVASSFVVLRRYLPLGIAFLATLVTLLHVLTIHISDLCFAELPFACATSLFFVFHGRASAGRFEAIAAACAAAAYLLRTIGIALLAAWIAERLFRRDGKGVLVRLCLAVLPVISWQAYVTSVERSPTYRALAYSYQRADYMFHNVTYARNTSLRDPLAPEHGHVSPGDIVRRFGENVSELPANLGYAVSTAWHPWRVIEHKLATVPGVGGLAGIATRAAPLLLGGLVVVGLVTLQRRGAVTLVLSVVFYALALCLAPWPGQFGRYWAPLTPLLCLALFHTFVAASEFAGVEHRRIRLRRVAVSVVAICLLVVQLSILILTYTRYHHSVAYHDSRARRIEYRLFFYTAEYGALDRGLDWLTAHAAPGDIVAASMPHWTYLRTGLHSVMPPFERDPEVAQRLLDSVPIRYIVMDRTVVNLARGYTQSVLQWARERWKPVYEAPAGDLVIYERTDERQRGDR